jgi:hypothetical protein
MRALLQTMSLPILLTLGLASWSGCEAQIRTDAPPPSKVDVQVTPPPAVDVDVTRKPGGADVDVNVKP